MKQIKLELTLEELTLLTGLAADQVFRREFIDPKMPGHKAIPGEVGIAKALVGRLRLIIADTNRGSGPAAAPPLGGRVSTTPAKRAERIPNAL